MNTFTQKLLLLLFSCTTFYAQNNSPWKKITPENASVLNKNSPSQTVEEAVLYQLDEIVFKESVSKIQNKSKVEISIPNINGELETFLVSEYSNFAPQLQAKYPDIRAYLGVGVTDKSASLSLSISPSGIQTMILRANSGSEFIDKQNKNTNLYQVYTSKNQKFGTLPFNCYTKDVLLNKQITNKTAKIASNNKVFKTLRLALSCTGEYTTYFGGTVAGALAAMNATMTRVNGIFNRDLAVKLELIANNNMLIYTDATTDPYSDAATGAGKGNWSAELQNNLTAVIGDSGYDIGHLFGASGDGGNSGCIGCVCIAPTVAEPLGKGSAFTSPENKIPEGDTFDIDFVAHEMGHQLGANHTFSYTIEGTDVSVEPGSGSTIMGYAGISIDYDVQLHSDDYFAYRSILQIQENLTTKTCPVSTPITNNPPTINAGLDYTIPKGTAFILKGTGSDPEGDAITYCWEQNDTATTQDALNSFAVAAKPDGPLFRSKLPTNLPVRYMPDLNYVLLNKLTSQWESVSDVARTLHFTLTGRDNAAQGTAQTNTDEMIVNVNATVGPFAITSQNSDNLSWAQGSFQTITWSLNGSDSLSGSANVNIKLSTDGGQTFPTILASSVPNDGSETIQVPDVTATTCRILIEPTANIYYAINTKDFAIGYTVTSACNTYTFSAPFAIPESAAYTSKTITVPTTTSVISDVNITVGVTHAYMSNVQIELANPQGTVVKLLDRHCGNTNGTLLLNYDDLGDVITCGKSTAQTVAPVELLTTFNDHNPQGNWTLRVRDAYTGDTGTLDAATLTICTKTFTPTTIVAQTINFAAYPNPNKGDFTLLFASKTKNKLSVSVYNLVGEKIFGTELENKAYYNETISLKNAQPGLYILSVTDGDRKEVKKLIIK